MIFKTTILKSNPQIIRVFEVNEEETLGLLLKVVAIVHGWKKTENLTILKNGEAVQSSDCIKEHFSEDTKDDQWEIQKNMPESYYSNQMGELEKWHFRLEVEDYSAPKDVTKGPLLIRYRGLNPGIDAVSIRFWNEMALTLEKNTSYYDYGRGYIYRSSFELKKSEVSTALKRLCSQKGAGVPVNFHDGYPLRAVLEKYKMDDLRRIARKITIEHCNSTRKQDLIAFLENVYKEESVLEVTLERMSYMEYENFKAFVSGEKNALMNHSETLRERGLAFSESRQSDFYIAQELVDFYKRYVEERGDEELIEGKKTEEILLCAGRLYGMFSWREAYALGEVMYPEMDLEERLTQYWQVHGEFGIVAVYDEEDSWAEDWEDYDEDELMYHTLSMKENTAVSYWNLIMSTEMEHYLPTREEALKIAREGLSFSPIARKEILAELQRVKARYQFYRDDEILDRIYQMCHLNMAFSDYASYLKRVFYLEGKNTDFARLVNVIRNHKGEVRQVLFCGHTSEDAKRLYHLELQER